VSMQTAIVSPLAPDPAAIAAAVEVLRSGGIVAYPTDTLYGLAVDPRDDEAVARLYDVKGRDSRVAVPLVASSLEQASSAGQFGAETLKVVKHFWPGPLTVVVPAAPGISSRVTGPGGTIAIRVPAHAVARALAAQFGFCISSSSANRSGGPAAVTAADAALRGVDLLLDGGVCVGGPPSTIVELSANGARLIRAGAIAWERVLESLE
jgi:L-threonylcarbamoyladenylate synthase